MSIVNTGLGALQEIGDKLYGLVDPGPKEFLRALPDSLFLGTSIFALITQSFPLGIFVLAMMEFLIVLVVLGGFVSAMQPNLAAPSSDQCTSGLPSLYQISAIGNILSGVAFPSGPTFFVTAALSYLLFSMLSYSDELEQLGKSEPEWKLRIPLGTTFSIALIAAFIVFRVWMKCESAVTALGSGLFGVGAGYLVYVIHIYLFGRDSTNILGLPLLTDRAAQGRPLYVCAKQKV